MLFQVWQARLTAQVLPAVSCCVCNMLSQTLRVSVLTAITCSII